MESKTENIKSQNLCNADYFFMEKVGGQCLEHIKANLPAETREAIELLGEFTKGDANILRSYGKTSFTVAEEQRKHLYALHLVLVMHIECYYRDYDTDDIFNFSRQYIGVNIEWLTGN
jgi:hypothetical protein